MRINKPLLLLTVAVVGLFLTTAITVAYGQLSQFMDPNDPMNITKLCNNYLASGPILPGDIITCADYMNKTMQEKYGYIPENRTFVETQPQG